MTAQKPSIGRIVHYVDTAIGSDPVPAIVTLVRDDQCLDLHVFAPHRSTSYGVERVMQRGEPREATDTRCWFWPPRA